MPKTAEMHTKRIPKLIPDASQPAAKKGKKKWVPPRGIRYSYRPDRATAPYYLHWRANGKTNTAGFDNETARELKAKALAEKRDEHGSSILSFDPDKWKRYCEFQKIVGEGIDPIVVAHEWRAAQQGTPKAIAKSVKDAITDYFKLRDEEKSWGAEARRHGVKQLGRFSKIFGTKLLNEVGADDVRNWLRDLKGDDGKKLGPHSIKSHRKNVKTFFVYCMRERWGAQENPCQFIKPPKTEDGDPVVISLREAWEFFKINGDQSVIARVAMEAFAGVRYTTSGAIAKDAINFDGRGIRMAARIHKTGKKDGRTRYRQGHPDNLWAWLNHAPDETWTMAPLEYREAKRNAAIRAGLRPISKHSDSDEEKLAKLRNIWRHSFISYHLAAYRNIATTQYLAQHSNPTTTEEYEGMADHEDALRYFMITPDTVKLSWEDFIKLPLPAKQGSSK